MHGAGLFAEAVECELHRHQSAREVRASEGQLAAASSDGSKVDPVVSEAVATGAAGPYMIAAMGFAGVLDGRRLSDPASEA
jgi:hypothetical protein